MIYSNMFSQVNVLEKALNATSLRHQIITNNIANADTPGYKKQTVKFEEYLRKELDSKNGDTKLINLNALNSNVVLENAQYSIRMDDNNVDIDVEMVERSKNNIKNSALTESITSNFKRISTVLNTMK